MDEKNSNQNTESTEAKKNKKTKKLMFKKPVITKRTASAIYMGIAVCMVAMLTVSLISTSNSVNQSLDELEDISIGLPDVSISFPDIGTTEKPDNKPTGTDNSNVDAEVIEPQPEKPKEEQPTYTRPVFGEILKGYYADALVFSETMQDYRTHAGVDITAALGEKVCAYTDGVISKIENDPFMGTTVEISHDGGVTSVYKNLSKELPKGIAVGVNVKTGDLIGTVGETAIIESADEPHLHFELWVNGESINSEREIASLK
ncbi:MAG: M23 family metallopeptidase [Clostridia bacterium]|nr:M23 family metallopeptidase [Clostridia bacterium]